MVVHLKVLCVLVCKRRCFSYEYSTTTLVSIIIIHVSKTKRNLIVHIILASHRSLSFIGFLVYEHAWPFQELFIKSTHPFGLWGNPKPNIHYAYYHLYIVSVVNLHVP